ncbi:PKD domain-containing protein [Sunxiuqinia sp. sy24]|uniref:PKD domain-containing protein n=1 Tax=Sunxiuqinia sp. sy24 TaxID=3461495 RepID=UPI0040457EE2
MKKQISLLFSFSALVFLLAFTSCKDDPEPPMAEIFFEVDENDPYSIQFSAMTQNASSYSWDFGDQDGTSTSKDPQYTYAMSGDYTVKLTAMGEGGEVQVTKQVSIAASVLEMLTGGPEASNGKTWVMSKTASNSDGAFSFSGTVYQAAPSDVLTMFGIGSEYDNEYTFHYDGKYSVAPKNGQVLASVIHAYVNNTIVGEPVWDLGLAVETYTAPASSTFTLNEGDFSFSARQENPQTQTVSEVETIDVNDANWISFSENAYFGILTYDTKVIIRDITANRMIVSMLVSTLSPEVYPEDFMKPSIMYTLSFEKK